MDAHHDFIVCYQGGRQGSPLDFRMLWREVREKPTTRVGGVRATMLFFHS